MIITGPFFVNAVLGLLAMEWTVSILMNVINTLTTVILMATVPILMVVSYVIVPLDMMEMASMIASISMNVILKLMTVHQFKIAKIQRF